MVRFDLSALPTSATITGAQLQLYVLNVQRASLTASVNVHALTAVFTESAVTWAKRTAAANWTTAGGDINGTVSASVAYSTLAAGSWVTFTIPAAVAQGWVTTPASNYGFMVKPSVNGDPGTGTIYNMAWFAASEHATVSLRPKLVLTYTALDNVKPLVVLKGPADGGTIMPGTNVIVRAEASDPDGTVTGVTFTVDGVLLRQVATAPFTATWPNVTVGTHTLTATAWDNTGASAVSAPITVQGAWRIYGAEMGTNPGWALGSGWGFGKPTGADGSYGYPDPAAGIGGQNVVGYNLSGPYGAIATPTSATTPAFNCANFRNTVLSFWYWLGVEGSGYDHAAVAVSSDGLTWQTVWSNPAEVLAGGVWRQLRLNIGAYADGKPTVSVRWQMGTTDSAYHFGGWNVDEVLVAGESTNTAADGDGDGVSDFWEQLNFGSTGSPEGGVGLDADGDGDSNLDEFVAGTDPLGSNDTLAVAIDDLPGKVRVSFTGRVANTNTCGALKRHYALETRPRLDIGTWTGLRGYTDLPAADRVFAVTNAVGTGRAYYRVKAWLK